MPVTYEAWVGANVDRKWSKHGQGRLRSFVSTQPIGGNVIDLRGGKVFRDAMQTAIEAMRSETIHVVVTDPAEDVGLTANAVRLRDLDVHRRAFGGDVGGPREAARGGR